MGERERILALAFVLVLEVGVLLEGSSVLSPLRAVHCRGARSWGLRVGSVVLHCSVSPRLAGRVLVRRVPHSVELHWCCTCAWLRAKFATANAQNSELFEALAVDFDGLSCVASG